VSDGQEVIARRLVRALRSDEPITLCLHSTDDPCPELEVGSLPESLAAIEVESGSAADYDALLGGAR
jgi:hypothetical protein